MSNNLHHARELDAQRAHDQHPDDDDVDRFAEAMKAKLAEARAKGRGGWEEDEPGMQQRLSDMLRAHVEKGDPRDVANFAMFLHQRGESILAAEKDSAQAASDGWKQWDPQNPPPFGQYLAWGAGLCDPSNPQIWEYTNWQRKDGSLRGRWFNAAGWMADGAPEWYHQLPGLPTAAKGKEDE